MFIIVVYAITQFEELLPFKLLSNFTPDYKLYSRHSVAFLAIFMYYRFSRTFLNLPETRPKLNDLVVGLEYFILTYAIASPVLIAFGVAGQTEDLIFLNVCALVLLSSIIIIYQFLKQSNRLTRFAMAGALLLVIGSILMIVLTKINEVGIVIPIDPFLPLLICVVAELLTFTSGLSFKTHMLELDKLNLEIVLNNELKAKHQVQEEMFNIRNQIARDLHDEIGSGLSKISLMGELIRRDNPGTEPKIDKIVFAAKSMIEEMSVIVWSLNSKYDYLANVLNYFKDYTHEYFEETGVSLKFISQNNLCNIPLTGLQRRNLMMAFKEVLNNALKHSKATAVEVEIITSKENVQIVIKDNGVGMYGIKERYNSNGLFNIKTRMKEIAGSVVFKFESGTTIILSFPIKTNEMVLPHFINNPLG